MPLSKDSRKGGTNIDGSLSTTYCSHCYQNGKFTLPELTVDQMKERVKGKMKELGFPGFLAGFLTKGIPKLERWKRF
jgi:hypothetical protein